MGSMARVLLVLGLFLVSLGFALRAACWSLPPWCDWVL